MSAERISLVRYEDLATLNPDATVTLPARDLDVLIGSLRSAYLDLVQIGDGLPTWFRFDGSGEVKARAAAAMLELRLDFRRPPLPGGDG